MKPIKSRENFSSFYPAFLSPLFRRLLLQNENRALHRLSRAERGSLPAGGGQSKGLEEIAQKLLGLCQGIHRCCLLAARTADCSILSIFTASSSSLL